MNMNQTNCCGQIESNQICGANWRAGGAGPEAKPLVLASPMYYMYLSVVVDELEQEPREPGAEPPVPERRDPEAPV